MDPTKHTPGEDIAKDPGLSQHQSSVAEDIEGYRHHNIYTGLPVSIHRTRSKHHHRHRHHGHHKHQKDQEKERPVTPPSERVQFILGENADDVDGPEIHPIFSEMETLCEMPNGDFEWKETARWVKFEEDVEEGGERWSKPHVSTLSLHSLFELRSFLLNGCVMLDMDAMNFEQICDLMLDNLINQGQMPYEARAPFLEALLRKHKHLYEKTKNKENGNMSRLPLIRSLAEIGRNHSSSKSGGGGGTDASMDVSPSQGSIPMTQSGNFLEGQDVTHTKKGNVHFMRKIPHGSEAANILVGEVNFLEKPVTAFVRLSQSVNLGDMTEVPVPSRFIFVILGPQGGLPRYHEIGRSVATLLSDEVFHEVAYKGKNRNHLLAGVDEFLDAVTVLPPGEWDPAIRIEPPAVLPSQEGRKKKEVVEEVDEEEEEQHHREEAGLVRTGRLFGGMVNDLKRKAPWFLSDFRDGIALQSVASFFFLYFACLTPIITFGGLLGEATGDNIAAMESLVAGLICGVTYGFFSGQPLTILGSTGPVLVFETILHNFCLQMEWDYLGFRFWIGMWAAFILLVLVAVDASALVCYITRFTEENFATLIAFIFIIKAVEKVVKIGSKYPMGMDTYHPKPCFCMDNPGYTEEPYQEDWMNISKKECLALNGTLLGDGCDKTYPDVFLMSLILFLGTFIISITLKEFKSASFFPTKVRGFISDFAVIIAIGAMTFIDIWVGIKTPKLSVPLEFEPTIPGRGWLVHPFGQGKNPWWSSLVALVPALLACILLFMDQQITAVIINRKEHKLKKGGGYHLDLFILSILIAVNSVMGLPWFVAATVLSINHVNSLKLESECAAPGEKPQFLGVRENRVTHILIFLFIGLSVLIAPILRKIPMPVLFGVFLYMGIAALKGIQLFDRILILFMPLKYQPDYTFLRQVPLKKVHLFTFIQILCLAALWVIKSFQQTSILFPLMLVVMIGVRKCLDWFFTQRELKILDDTLPEFSRKEKLELEDDEDKDENDPGATGDKDGMMAIPLANGNIMRVPVNPINISEEMNKSGVWKDINNEGVPVDKSIYCCDDTCKRPRRRRKKKRDRSKEGEYKSSSGQSNGYAKMNGHDHSQDLEANEIDFGRKKKKSREDVELINVTEVNERDFSKKRGSKKDAIFDDERKRLSMMAEEDEDEDKIVIKVKK